MIHKAKDLTLDQRVVVEGLLGRSVEENEAISIRSLVPGRTPEWLLESWESAERQDVDELSSEEIDAEIAAARKARRTLSQTLGQ